METKIKNYVYVDVEESYNQGEIVLIGLSLFGGTQNRYYNL
jgi:hypothetical protein